MIRDESDAQLRRAFRAQDDHLANHDSDFQFDVVAGLERLKSVYEFDVEAGLDRLRTAASGGEIPDPEQGPLVAEGDSQTPALPVIVGQALRQLREKLGISGETAGNHIRCSSAKIMRLELGRTGFRERDIKDLLTLYGIVDSDERQAFLKLAREANRSRLWASLRRSADHLTRRSRVG